MAFLFLVSLVMLGAGVRATIKGGWPALGLNDRSKSRLLTGIGALLFAAVAGHGRFLITVGLLGLLLGILGLIGRASIFKVTKASHGLLIAIAGFIVVMIGVGVLPASTVDHPDPSASGSRSTSRSLANAPPIIQASPSVEAFTPPAPSPSPAKPPEPSTSVPVIAANVTKIVDGDTAQMSLSDGRNEKVRFIGMDTPEVGKPHAGEATGYTSQMISNKQVWLEIGTGERDRYGRLLAYVWLSPPKRADDAEARSSMLNAKLLLDGFAQLMTVPPNVKYVNQFRAYQEEARTGERGLWEIPVEAPPSAPPPTAPSRGGNCDPSYPDVCIPSPPPDLDCGEISHEDFTVLQPDPHGFDGDDDGIGCES